MCCCCNLMIRRLNSLASKRHWPSVMCLPGVATYSALRVNRLTVISAISRALMFSFNLQACECTLWHLGFQWRADSRANLSRPILGPRRHAQTGPRIFKLRRHCGVLCVRLAFYLSNVGSVFCSYVGLHIGWEVTVFDLSFHCHVLLSDTAVPVSSHSPTHIVRWSFL
jgi:hypothetical protein